VEGMKSDVKICATCQYNTKLDGEWTCDNETSEAYGQWTEFDDTCPEWEERE